MENRRKDLGILMGKIDKRTLEILCKDYDVLGIISDLCGYIQETNKEIVAIKKAIRDNTGIDIQPLSEEQKKKLRAGGDTLTGIQKIIAQGKYMKERDARINNG